MARLVLTRRAHEQLSELPESVRGAVAATIEELAISPEQIGKPLLGRLAGTWSARVGSYRILFTLEGTRRARRVIVRSIRHRAVVYKRRPRR